MAQNILDKIFLATQDRVKKAEKEFPLEKLQAVIANSPARPPFTFEKALAGKDVSFICEVKKASPSKGLIAKDFPYLDIAQDYERAGAAAISILTEPEFFQGSNKYLQEIRQVVDIPLLRKDFTISEYQIYEAKALGADAILLICAILTEDAVRYFREIADGLGLSCLVEAHNEEEISMALRAGARIIGVNNRNLKDFTMDVANSLRLRHLVPDNVLFVSESGIKTGEDVKKLRDNKVAAALIGETLMRSKDKVQAINQLSGRVKRPEIKLCGFSRPEDIELANKYKPDYIGFVFYPPSKRYVTKAKSKELKALLDKDIKAVGVFVNSSYGEIMEYIKEGIIDIVQLHGDETPELIRKLKESKVKVIRSLAADKTSEEYAENIQLADAVLLDTASREYGGTGKSFDWGILEDKLARLGNKKYFLAGGLNSRNIVRAIRRFQPAGVDMSSCLETQGCKDEIKIKKIMELIRSVINE